MTALEIRRADGLMTVQDMGRPGHLAQGLPRGGAMDRLALIEAAALLGAAAPLAAVEMAGAGGLFGVTSPTRVALTGAPMAATLDDAPVGWNRSHLLVPGQVLRIGGAEAGTYGYLTPAGGIAGPEWLDSRATHLTIGIGQTLATGDSLPIGDDRVPDSPARRIEAPSRFGGGTVRIAEGPQTGLFDAETLAAFAATGFIRAARGNRQGVQLDADRRFTSALAAGLASDIIGPGDVQMTGDGIPYVLLAECQTIGGYPRIGTVIPADLPLVAQTPPGGSLRFRLLDTAEADRLHRSDAALLREARSRCHRLIRDPATIADLLSYTLISGVTRGDDLDGPLCA